MRFHLSPIAAAAGIFMLAANAQGQAQTAEIKPPFGLVWGENADRLERMLKVAKATVVERRQTAGGLEAWDVDGIKQEGLKRTIFFFRSSQLVRVELIYQSSDWDQKKYDELMSQMRQILQRRYGEGALIARKNEPVGDVAQRIVGYQWNNNNAVIELFYYSAQNGRNVFKTISVHYKSS